MTPEAAAILTVFVGIAFGLSVFCTIYIVIQEIYKR